MKLQVALAGFVLSAGVIYAQIPSVTVYAGDYERRNVLVQFPASSLPSLRNLRSFVAAEMSPTETLIDGTDRFGRAPLKASPTGVQHVGQVDEDGNAFFVLPELDRKQKRTFQLLPFQRATNITADRTEGTVEMKVNGKRAFTYHIAKTDFPPNRPDLKPIFHRAAYIHPVLTPSGAQVTDDYPRNHKHHHAIWMSWTGTEFEGRHPDFWNMGDGKGTVEFEALDKVWSGPVHAGFIARHRYIDLTATKPTVALNETWNVRLYTAGSVGAKPYYLFDLEIRDECATKEPVGLPEYRYGGICVRGNWAWNGKTNAFLLTSEGETNRALGDKANLRARWVHLGGLVNGKFAGIATLAHPTNFRFPEPIRTNPAEPYYNFTPQQAGDMEITPEKPFVARYRFVVADGKADLAELERLWNDYAHPPKATVNQ
jgi:hypothetical protein